MVADDLDPAREWITDTIVSTVMGDVGGTLWKEEGHSCIANC